MRRGGEGGEYSGGAAAAVDGLCGKRSGGRERAPRERERERVSDSVRSKGDGVIREREGERLCIRER